MRADAPWFLRYVAIAVALVAVLLTGALAAAQEPVERFDFGCPESTVAFEPPRPGETETLLSPGLNLVGWIGETMPVSNVFAEIPQLDEIWAWDAELGEWVGATPGGPDRANDLTHVVPGMGLQMQICDSASASWRRSAEPARGLVRLRTGWNLVGWNGPSGTSIEDAVKGIGWSLRTVQRWDAARQRWLTWTSPERSAQLIATSGVNHGIPSAATALRRGLRRGEALWINVSRAVNWLQPTGVLPRLVFPGGASPDLQARVRADLQDTLGFFRDQYGIQADPSFTIYVAKDVEALIQTLSGNGGDAGDVSDPYTRALWNRWGGWATGKTEIVVKQESWPSDLAGHEFAGGRYTLTHEYFHILQNQLSDGGWPATWLTEGTARWMDEEHAVFDGLRTQEDVRIEKRSSISSSTPTLRSTERGNATWQYTLGWLAIDQLSEVAGVGSHIEFWRRLISTEAGPGGHWTSDLDWRSAFEDVFGVTVPRFYSDYFQPLRLAMLETRTWEEQQAAEAAKQTYAGFPPVEATILSDSAPSPDDSRQIRGRITNESDAPVVGALVSAIRIEGEVDVGWNRRSETGSDGTFAVPTSIDGTYRLSVDLSDDCSRYYNDGHLVDSVAEAEPVYVGESGLEHVNIRLPRDVCGWHIRGRVMNIAGEPLAGISVVACPTDRSAQCINKPTSLDGRFTLPAVQAGEYRLYLRLVRSIHSSCLVHYNQHGLVFGEDEASLVVVRDGDVSGLTLYVPADSCRWRVIGRVIQANGQPLADVQVFACREEADPCTPPGWWELGVFSCRQTSDGCVTAHAFTNEDGSFVMVAPTGGRYSLGFRVNGCGIYVRGDGFTASFSERLPERVEGRDVRLVLPPVPADPCAPG